MRPQRAGGAPGALRPAGSAAAPGLGAGSECVHRDAYDAAAFASLRCEDPRLRECSRRGETSLRSFPALLGDVFCLLFKLRPTLIERSLVRPAFQVNRYLVARLWAESELRSLRGRTALDERAAAAATASVGEQLRRELAAYDLAEENLIFELEASLEEGRGARGTPAPVRRKAVAGRDARAAGEADGAGRLRLEYDLQQRLDDDPTGAQPTEVYDVSLGAELARLLPSELLALRAPARRREFLRRMLARQLLTYQITGRPRSTPMVILVDASHSMAGEKDLAAKALAIALAEVAAERAQAVHVVLFGHRNATRWQLDLPARRPTRREIAELAETFFGGGTDFEAPFASAFDLIARTRAGEGQVVLISDGLCEVDAGWLAEARDLRTRRGIRVLGVLVDRGTCSYEAAARVSDRVIRWSELVDGIAPRAGRL
jgi:Mg-chelatase subunit ChlD